MERGPIIVRSENWVMKGTSPSHSPCQEGPSWQKRPSMKLGGHKKNESPSSLSLKRVPRVKFGNCFANEFTKTRVPSNSPWKGAKWTNWIACEKNELPWTLPKKGLSQEKMIEIGYWNWLTQRSKLKIGKLIVGNLNDPEVEIGWPNGRNWELVDRRSKLSDSKVKIENWMTRRSKLKIEWPEGRNW